MDNPLLELTGLPPFSAIKPHHVEPAIDFILEKNRARINGLLQVTEYYTWTNLLGPLEEMEDQLNRAWSPVGHLNAVVNSDEWRRVYNACLPKLSAYATELGQNERLYQAFLSIAQGPEYQKLSIAQRKVIDNGLRDFRLSGVALDRDKKRRFKEIAERLSILSAKFSENVLDATDAWKKRIERREQLAGLPEHALDMARQAAQRDHMDGWLLNLEHPSYLAVMTYADDRALRAEMYEAYVTRASDSGPHAGRWDNTPVMEETLALRHEKANLLGFKHYAEYSLATKMAASPEQVVSFLSDLAQRSLAMAKTELEELRDFARRTDDLQDFESWDALYYSEKLRQHRYAISDEELKPYFPHNRVLDGLFSLVNRLYGLTVKERKDVDTWHVDARFFDIFDHQGALRGQFFLDLFARPHKRGGAWMDECIGRRRNTRGVQTPVAYLTCNFTPPLGSQPALLTQDEVLTLFHEFGHGLHHMLTKVDYLNVAGIAGVPWDAVELPSQFMENWCWQRDVIDMMSGHYQTGEPLPPTLFDRMTAAKNFQTGMQMLRQIEFALFDFRLHLEYDPARGSRIYDILAEVRDQVAVMNPPSFNRFPHSFSHIFAGGYAAGYYSYKWAEVLSSDAFAHFEENGVFDRDTGLRFLTTILEQGGSRDPMDLFVEFRGRPPQIDALLRHSGITAG